MSPEAKINQIYFDLLINNRPLPMWIYDHQSFAPLEIIINLGNSVFSYGQEFHSDRYKVVLKGQPA